MAAVGKRYTAACYLPDADLLPKPACRLCVVLLAASSEVGGGPSTSQANRRGEAEGCTELHPLPWLPQPLAGQPSLQSALSLACLRV
jgi:hypothetical protein